MARIDSARTLMALGAYGGDGLQAYEVMKSRFGEQSIPTQFIRQKFLQAGQFDDQQALRGLSNGLLQVVRESSVLGKINAIYPLRYLPVGAPLLIENEAILAEWVSQGSSKPVKDISLAIAPKLKETKLSIITPFSTDFLKLVGDSNAEAQFQSILVNAINTAEAQTFLSADEASTAQPGGLLNGVDATGGDIGELIDAFAGDLATSVLIMSGSSLVKLNRAGNDNVSISGGSYAGIPVVISKSAGDNIVLLDVNQLIVADTGMMLDATDQAILQTESGDYLNLYQQNLSAIRAERFINWQLLRNDAVSYIDGSSI